MKNLILKNRLVFLPVLLLLLSLNTFAQERPCYPFADPQMVMEKIELLNKLKLDPLWQELQAVREKQIQAMQFGMRFIKIDRQKLSTTRPVGSENSLAVLLEAGIPNAKEMLALDQRARELNDMLNKKYPEFARRF